MATEETPHSSENQRPRDDNKSRASVASDLASSDGEMEPEVLDADILLPPVLPFKKVHTSEKHPEDHSGKKERKHLKQMNDSEKKGWKYLKQMLDSQFKADFNENYDAYPAETPHSSVASDVASAADCGCGMEQEVVEADILLPSVLPFKKVQTSEKYPEEHSEKKEWKNLEERIESENYESYPAGEPNYVSIQSTPSSYSARASDLGNSAIILEQEVLDADILLPSVLPFKKVQPSLSNKKRWKRLKQMIGSENYEYQPAGEPNYVSLQSPPPMYPAKKYCDISGFPTSYKDPLTNLRYANVEMFKRVRSLSHEDVESYLELRKARVTILK